MNEGLLHHIQNSEPPAPLWERGRGGERGRERQGEGEGEGDGDGDGDGETKRERVLQTQAHPPEGHGAVLRMHVY